MCLNKCDWTSLFPLDLEWNERFPHLSGLFVVPSYPLLPHVLCPITCNRSDTIYSRYKSTGEEKTTIFFCVFISDVDQLGQIHAIQEEEAPCDVEGKENKW